METEDRHIKEREMHRVFEHFASERRGEWFKIDRVQAINIFNLYTVNKLSEELENEQKSADNFNAGYVAFSRVQGLKAPALVNATGG